jgi:hypothetical protein
MDRNYFSSKPCNVQVIAITDWLASCISHTCFVANAWYLKPSTKCGVSLWIKVLNSQTRLITTFQWWCIRQETDFSCDGLCAQNNFWTFIALSWSNKLAETSDKV